MTREPQESTPQQESQQATKPKIRSAMFTQVPSQMTPPLSHPQDTETPQD